jgi:hypothetical protein
MKLGTFLQPRAISYQFGPNIPLSTVFPVTLYGPPLMSRTISTQINGHDSLRAWRANRNTKVP